MPRRPRKVALLRSDFVLSGPYSPERHSHRVRLRPSTALTGRGQIQPCSGQHLQRLPPQMAEQSAGGGQTSASQPTPKTRFAHTHGASGCGGSTSWQRTRCRSRGGGWSRTSASMASPAGVGVRSRRPKAGAAGPACQRMAEMTLFASGLTENVRCRFVPPRLFYEGGSRARRPRHRGYCTGEMTHAQPDRQGTGSTACPSIC